MSDADKAYFNQISAEAGVGAEGATGLGTAISQVESAATSSVGAQLGSSAATSVTTYVDSVSAVAISAASSAASAGSKAESVLLLAKSYASSNASSTAIADSKAVSCGLWDLAWSTFTSVVSAGSISASGASVAKASYPVEGNVISVIFSTTKSTG
jgi:hypothetical protein